MVVVAGAAAALWVAPAASALGPVDVEVAAKVGGVTTPSNAQNGLPDPIGFAAGGRAGVAYKGLYGGISIVYLIGSTPRSCSSFPGCGPPGTNEIDSLMYGVEAGYGLKAFEIVTLRGQVGVGNLAYGITSPSNSLYVEPGISGIVPLTFVAPWFVGADAALLILHADNTWGPPGIGFSFAAQGQLGVKF